MDTHIAHKTPATACMDNGSTRGGALPVDCSGAFGRLGLGVAVAVVVILGLVCVSGWLGPSLSRCIYVLLALHAIVWTCLFHRRRGVYASIPRPPRPAANKRRRMATTTRHNSTRSQQ